MEWQPDRHWNWPQKGMKWNLNILILCTWHIVSKIPPDHKKASRESVYMTSLSLIPGILGSMEITAPDFVGEWAKIVYTTTHNCKL